MEVVLTWMNDGGGGGGGVVVVELDSQVDLLVLLLHQATQAQVSELDPDKIPIIADSKTKGVTDLLDRFLIMHIPEGEKKTPQFRKKDG
jgi:hypothetical protein